MEFHRGSIYNVKLSKQKGSIQSGERGFLILQNELGNKFAPTVIGVPITSKLNKRDLPIHVDILPDNLNGLNVKSTIICEQLMTIDKSQIIHYIGRVSEENMKKVEIAIQISLGLIPIPKKTNTVIPTGSEVENCVKSKILKGY